MELVIREAEEKDADTMMSLIRALSSHEGSEEYVQTDVDKLKLHGFGTDRKFETLLAEDNGDAIGYLTYICNYSIWAGDYYMFVEDLFVLEPYRRLGVGNALMDQAKAVCKEQNRLFMKWEVQ